MRLRIIFTLGIPLLFLMNTYGQVSSDSAASGMIIGKWKAADSTAFRGKEIEFLPDNQVNLILANGGKQEGQYEIKGTVITFSIGDAPPFNMHFRLENGDLYLAFPENKAVTKYVKQND